ncbi:MAG: hypothetical protein LBB51_06655 [Zoogloeaceae bacterium]|jgi:hypothetical protein|nr:hypothetical protein [Zoogloeaceae bacterium]
MRWVLDTNILVFALIWRRSPRTLLERGFAAGVQFHTSPALLAELRATLRYAKLVAYQRERGLDPDTLFDAARHPAQCGAPPLPAPVSRDPDDEEKAGRMWSSPHWKRRWPPRSGSTMRPMSGSSSTGARGNKANALGRPAGIAR